MRETEGPAAFDAEKQNEPVNPDDCFFLEEDFVFWEDRWDSERSLVEHLGKRGRFVGACDPSLGREGKHADDSAIITLLKDTDSGTLYVLDADIDRRKPDRILETILAYQRIRKYSRFGFEANHFQSFLAEELQRRSRGASLNLPVEPVTNATDKIGRIQSLQPLVRSGTLQFSRRHTLLLEQLRLFPKASHDDGPDALEMAVATARAARRTEMPVVPRNSRRVIKVPRIDWSKGPF
ncbi:MAG: phage terminase large subunit [Phycisphaerales bacterium]|nr:phage terminase large subunit [Phycisphaerales bacterium]